MTRRPSSHPHWFAVAWHVPPDGLPRFAADDFDRLLVWAVRQAAVLFAERLASHGLEAFAVPVTPVDVAEVLRSGGVPDAEIAERVLIVERQTTGRDDLAAWSVDLADRLVSRRGAVE